MWKKKTVFCSKYNFFFYRSRQILPDFDAMDFDDLLDEIHNSADIHGSADSHGTADTSVDSFLSAVSSTCDTGEMDFRSATETGFRENHFMDIISSV